MREFCATKPQTLLQTCLACTVSSTYSIHTENFAQKCAERRLGRPHPASTHVEKSEPEVSIAREKTGRGVTCTNTHARTHIHTEIHKMQVDARVNMPATRETPVPTPPNNAVY